MTEFKPHFPNNFISGDILPLMLLGEAPGAAEEVAGMPFVGMSGKLLMSVFEQYGFTRDKLYISNVFWKRPPNNDVKYFFQTGYKLKPEFQHVFGRLDNEINILQPKLIFSLGRIPTWALTKDNNIRITSIVGKTFEYKNTTVMPIYHPAYILRNRQEIDNWKNDIKNGIDLIKKWVQ